MTSIALPRKGLAHRNAPDTELAAAESITSVTGRLRVQVLHLVTASVDGLTDDEGGALMGGDRRIFAPRRNELVRAGYIQDSGLRRPTPTGRSAIVWTVV